MAGHQAGSMPADLEQYFTQSFETKLLKQLPDDDAQLTSATRLLEKRRELAAADTAQQDHKQKHDRHMMSINERREGLVEEERKLKKSLEDYETYLKENDLRRRRADKKTREESAACEALDDEIDVLQRKIDLLHRKRENQELLLRRQAVYETYLKSVLGAGPDFDEINELIDRYVTLKTTNEELVNQERENQAHMQDLQKEGQKNRDNHKVVMLRLNNHIASLQTEVEQLGTERLHWENQATLAENAACKRTLLLGRIKMATANLYTLVRARGRAGGDRLMRTEKQLEKIRTYMKDLAQVVEEYESGALDGILDAR